MWINYVKYVKMCQDVQLFLAYILHIYLNLKKCRPTSVKAGIILVLSLSVSLAPNKTYKK